MVGQHSLITAPGPGRHRRHAEWRLPEWRPRQARWALPGWRALFPGQTLPGWRTLLTEWAPPGWRRLATLGGAIAMAALVVGFVPGMAGAASDAPLVRTAGSALNLRSTPSTALARIGTLPNGSTLSIVCQQTGEQIVGLVRTTAMWDRLKSGAYVSDAYVARASTPPPCSPPPATPSPPGTVSPSGWTQPVNAPIGDGFRPPNRPTHQGVDLLASRGTPVRAVAAGTVITSQCDPSTGSCDVDGSIDVPGCGWYVEIQHAGQVITRYCHLGHQPQVQAGQRVTAGQVLGVVGSSGNSTGPHLHFEVHVGRAPATSANAVDPAQFMRAAGARIDVTDGGR